MEISPKDIDTSFHFYGYTGEVEYDELIRLVVKRAKLVGWKIDVAGFESWLKKIGHEKEIRLIGKLVKAGYLMQKGTCIELSPTCQSDLARKYKNR